MVIVLFNDIIPCAGGTYIAPDGINNIVKRCVFSLRVDPCFPREAKLTDMGLTDTVRLYEHPEGADHWPQDKRGTRTVCDIQKCGNFVEV